VLRNACRFRHVQNIAAALSRQKACHRRCVNPIGRVVEGAAGGARAGSGGPKGAVQRRRAEAESSGVSGEWRVRGSVRTGFQAREATRRTRRQQRGARATWTAERSRNER